MTQREKFGAFFFALLGFLLGFFIFDLLEQRKQHTARLRVKRNQRASINGFDVDQENMKKDWQNVENDLKKGTQKAISQYELQ